MSGESKANLPPRPARCPGCGNKDEDQFMRELVGDLGTAEQWVCLKCRRGFGIGPRTFDKQEIGKP